MRMSLVGLRFAGVASMFMARTRADSQRSSQRPACGPWLSMCLAFAAIGCGQNASPTNSDAGGGAQVGPANSGRGGASAGTAAAGTGGTAASKSLDQLAGSFTLRLIQASQATDTTDARPAQTSFLGTVADGETPVAMNTVLEQETGGCKLYTPKQPFCSKRCGATAVCVADEQCVERPTPQDVGTIHLSGVGDADVSMTYIAGNYQPKAGTSLPYPPCSEGDQLGLAADGGAYPPFSLSARCIAPLEFAGPVELVKGSPLALDWNAAQQTDRTRIQVRLDISHHGGTRGKIECDLEDTGHAEIAAELVDKLLDLGVAGFPTISLTRVATGGAEQEPSKVVFSVQQSIELAVQIEGLVSCTEDAQCPAPMTCQADLTCK